MELNILLQKPLSKELLMHVFAQYLSTNITSLNLSNQSELDSDIIKILAHDVNASAIIYLNLKNTQVGYAGIVEILKSKTFGTLISDTPIYEKHTGMPIITINIEISNTRALQQFKDKKFKYPFPYIRDIEITYGHNRIGGTYQKFGYRSVVLLNDGKEIKNYNI